jgi:ABC-type Fe3+/spermidine/putrescine transport system ATPase subunit
MSLLRAEGISKAYGGEPALKEVNLSLSQGEILCLLGPSGCGKTTLLRIIAGLETPDVGEVFLKGQDLNGVPVHQRGLGFMFQEFALFPHKDVYGNVAFGLRMARLPRREIERRVNEVLELVGLEGFIRRTVHDLSGGERQRVALARSLAPRPHLLMLDEPLSSLDRALRERLMNELRHILKSVDVSALYVTHDQSEAFALGDRVAIMQKGCIEQIGPPESVYRRPSSPFVARFLGMSNLLPGSISEPGAGQVRTVVGELQTEDAIPSEGKWRARKVTVLLRPKAARLADGRQEIINSLQGEVVERSFRGGYYRLLVRHSSGTELAFELDRGQEDVPMEGDEVTLSLSPREINLLPDVASGG